MLLSMVIIACLLFCVRKTNDNFMAWLSKDILGYLVLVRIDFGNTANKGWRLHPVKQENCCLGFTNQ